MDRVESPVIPSSKNGQGRSAQHAEKSDAGQPHDDADVSHPRGEDTISKEEIQVKHGMKKKKDEDDFAQNTMDPVERVVGDLKEKSKRGIGRLQRQEVMQWKL
jgi:hypothetical protein